MSLLPSSGPSGEPVRPLLFCVSAGPSGEPVRAGNHEAELLAPFIPGPRGEPVRAGLEEGTSAVLCLCCPLLVLVENLSDHCCSVSLLVLVENLSEQEIMRQSS